MTAQPEEFIPGGATFSTCSTCSEFNGAVVLEDALHVEGVHVAESRPAGLVGWVGRLSSLFSCWKRPGACNAEGGVGTSMPGAPFLGPSLSSSARSTDVVIDYDINA